MTEREKAAMLKDIPCEYDDYAIDESKLSQEPLPHEEVMRKLRENIQAIREKYAGESEGM